MFVVLCVDHGSPGSLRLSAPKIPNKVVSLRSPSHSFIGRTKMEMVTRGCTDVGVRMRGRGGCAYAGKGWVCGCGEGVGVRMRGRGGCADAGKGWVCGCGEGVGVRMRGRGGCADAGKGWVCRCGEGVGVRMRGRGGCADAGKGWVCGCGEGVGAHLPNISKWIGYLYVLIVLVR